MAHLAQPSGRIPLPQLPPLAFETPTESDCDQIQTACSLETLLSTSTILRASAKYTENDIGSRDYVDRKTDMSFQGHDCIGGLSA
jgi:hypothetical protein